MIYALHLDDYFDVEEFDWLLRDLGYDLVHRTYDAVNTIIEVKPSGDAAPLDALVDALREALYTTVSRV